MNITESDHMHQHMQMTESNASQTGAHKAMKSMMHHGMSMTFHFGDDETILFKFWAVHNAGFMVLSCFIIIVLCFIMEGIRWFRSFRKASKRQIRSAPSINEQPSFFRPHISVALCIDTVLHAVQLTISYILMLLFMTFNVWLCIAVVLGEVLGRFIFNAFFPTAELSASQVTFNSNCSSSSNFHA
ncbi:unnamed protein product [Anisakis simplex]|uniref:Copper transport protein n=1 Tax=Anisakis simplex TaxID=6269 RepID=A0A0M3JYE2_ANISI|nr:unnamed protein product [Anisakis simplex]